MMALGLHIDYIDDDVINRSEIVHTVSSGGEVTDGRRPVVISDTIPTAHFK